MYDNFLKNNLLIQTRLDEIKHYADKNDMIVNRKKTKILPFNFSRKYDFMPHLEFDNETLEVVYQAKLLGVILDSSGRWNEHINYVTRKAKQRVFMLQRLKRIIYLLI